MPETYQAILRANHIEWSGAAPMLSADAAVRVQITLLEKVDSNHATLTHGARMAHVLGRLAACDGALLIGDATAWQREIRQDRLLPDRDE